MFHTLFSATSELLPNREGFPFWDFAVTSSTILLSIITGVMAWITVRQIASEEHRHAERMTEEEHRHTERMAELEKATRLAAVKGEKEIVKAIKEAHHVETDTLPVLTLSDADIAAAEMEDDLF